MGRVREARWYSAGGRRRGSQYNAIKKTKLFFSTAFGIVSCYSNKSVQEKYRHKKYGHFSLLKVCLSKVHSIDFHDKRIKPMSLKIEIC